MKLLSIVPGSPRPDLIRDETLAELFRTSARQHSTKTALVFGERRLTYAQLDSWSDAVAVFLASRGIGPGQAVGIWWPRSLELHVAILGIVKSGAAYVPLDREMPAERVETVLTEVKASAYFSDQSLQLDCPQFNIPAFNAPAAGISLPAGPQPDNWAYVLYTSGSTGKPKGIPINHRQICHLIRAEQSVINIREEDYVYQGFSVSFDMWCEETWISLFVGATLWVADAVTARSIDELSDVLRREKITILHAVPSLLAVMDDDIPSIRLVNAGGEACTPQVLARWSKPTNIFYNSYGPTETTVTATMTPLKPGDPITIGSPLPNYNLAVVDAAFNIVPFGEPGELIITGPGVCNGYVNRDDLTKEKFLPKLPAMNGLPGDRFYRTGDAVIIHPDHSVEFQGRIDDQIKLRGYRIELGEIESQLNALNGVSAAAVAVKKDNNKQDQLVGYVLMKNGTLFEESVARTALAKVLPPYMVPGVVVALPEMPRLPSGKIDRKSLPVPEALLQAPAEETGPINLSDSVGNRVQAVLRRVFPGKEVDPSQDFFTDLGGHSLLAATFVSRLRKEAGIPHASLKDVYTNRPLQTLITIWEKKNEQQPKEQRIFHSTPWWRYLACGSAQAVALLLVYGLFAIQILVPYLGYYYVVSRTESGTGDVHYALITAICLFCVIPPFFSVLSIIAKWLIIGKMKEGDYPMWGTYYFRWWMVNVIQRLVPAQFMNGTPLYSFYLRMMGVKVAPDAQLSAVTIGAEDLITIGKDVSISSLAVLNNAVVEDGLLKLRRITIGDHAYIGSSAVISGGTVIEDWGELQDLSHLQPGSVIREGEVWKGSPAQRIDKKKPEELPQPLRVSVFKRYRFGLLFSSLLIVFPLVVLIPLLPVLVLLNYLDTITPGDYDFSYLIYTPFLAICYICIYALETILLSRLLQRKLQPGTYPVYGWTYIRKWLADQLISMSLIVLHPIYATVYVSTFFRALGAKIGKNTEISTASSVTHPMLEIGSEAFIADAVTLGEADVRAQQLIVSKTTIGDSSFVGNSALIPQGYALPGNMLIGVLSTPPTTEQMNADKTRDWFGSPAIALPVRQDSGSFPAYLTTTPTIARKIFRAIVEFIRIIIPETVVICCSVLFIAYEHDLIKNRSLLEIGREIYKLPFYYLFFLGLPALLVTALLKWVFVGKYKKMQKPMWTHKVWRSEAITTTYEALAVPFLLEYLKGTPFLPMALRLLGVKIGKKVWLNTTDITEYDMVSIGSETALNDDCGPQTHLFEDRVMKVGPVKIGSRCSVAARSIILYDSEIGDNTKLEPLSLVMKGENLPAGEIWTGSPVRSA